ncbi:aldehyde dehydrogenase family protein [Phocicoccus pinnipedialis]|uniref:Aldehyde dehydrogenase n=1 Tax=Phocicoccus pinnipedialis TaxID=110845 RepID=A0A6V7RDT2_9BACL|nr:aldehyde dehydrogenase family protein [Jeotgalicoccus pinnipedialis]MBP1939508.1 aldehyde dehydrogenase (NAD+) [Jeotgalicoccus pinnipedialis]CAD2075094.1 Putative aldehyde dehydrogenase [Jeotgalicoccus pinnipedialis]
MNYDKLYINGEWVESHSNEIIEVENPATKERFAKVPKGNEKDVDDAVEAAKIAYKEWNNTDFETRKEYLKKIRDGIEKRQSEFESIIRKELGSSYHFTTTGQVQLSLNEIDAVLEHSDKVKFEEKHDGFTLLREGIGVVAGITPWNYPLNQIQRKLSGALLSGSTIVVKPSSDTPIAAFLLAEVIDEAGLPAGVFNLVTGSGSGVGDYLAGHEDVRMVSFTGSTDVGKKLYEQAEKTVKKISLELGGKSANVVLEGGDLEKAVNASMDTLTNNTGQSCSALSRLLIPEDKKQEAEKYITQYVKEKVRVGNPEDEENTMGPVVSKKQYEQILAYIESGKKEGATVLVGGDVPELDGYYINSTVFTDVTNDMTIAKEEIFGPVLCVITYKDKEEALEIANDSTYGLSGAVFGDSKEAFEFAKQMETGTVILNGAKRMPYAPWGGYKESGVGREIGWFGIEEYTEIKVVLNEE